jgi:hypothetical protein
VLKLAGGSLEVEQIGAKRADALVHVRIHGAAFAMDPNMVARAARRWIEVYARAGFVSKGAVYLVLGVLALKAATGSGGRITGREGVLQEIFENDYGTVLVVALSVGLAGYSLWRFIEALGDANRKGKKPESVIVRAGYALSGVIYGFLAVDAVTLLLGSSDSAANSYVLRLVLGSPLGPVLVVLVGLGLLAYAIREVVRALQGKVDDELSLGSAPRRTARWVKRMVNFGMIARAVVFVIVGVLLLRAASTPVAAASIDTTDGLRFAAGLPEGRWWLAFVAAGFTAYGLEQVVQAFYRRIITPGS